MCGDRVGGGAAAGGDDSGGPGRQPAGRPACYPACHPPALQVNSLGKWKTALQMVAMSALLILRKSRDWAGLGPDAAAAADVITRAALALLWGGALLAVVSLHYYMARQGPGFAEFGA